MHETQKKIEAQKQLRQSNQWPEFIPGDGFCVKCGKQMFNLITRESSGMFLLTCCPYCHYSYCD